MQNAKKRRRDASRAISLSAFCILHFAFPSPPHLRLTRPCLHPAQFLLLLLLHGTKQRFEIELSLLRLGRLLLLLLLVVRLVGTLTLGAPGAASLRLLLPCQCDLQVPFRRRVVGAKPEHF